MSLVTVQRSPSTSNASSTISNLDNDDEEAEERLKRGCESFFAMKGAALVLPHSKDTQRPIKKHPGLAPTVSAPPSLDLIPGPPPASEALVGELQNHLQCIFWLLRTQDTIKMAVRLETSVDRAIRYMVLVSCLDPHQNTEETIILGVDILGGDQATVGLVLPIWADTGIHMGGDGGFTVTTGDRVNIFKPISIQAMWSALQALNKACDVARKHNYFKGGLHMTWIGFYESSIQSPYHCLTEWAYLPDNVSPQRDEIKYIYYRDGRYCPTEDELIRRFIFVKLKEVMIHSDLEVITCKMLRQQLEKEIDKDLTEYRKFIDKQIITIYGQLDSASQIFDHIYLGSEWNASNLEELEANGVGYILNITKECDNFFPDRFQYCNIRLYDMEVEDLLRHWDTTNRFLAKAKEAGSKALVHCKMGISRSASTVIAYAMKEYEMTLEEALRHVDERRPIIRPNKSFMKQLQIYEGILLASRNRRKMFRSKSDSSLSRSGSAENLAQDRPSEPSTPDDAGRGLIRNKSWCTRDNKQTLDSPEGAASGASFTIGPDPTHLGAGGFTTGGDDDDDKENEGDDECSEIRIPVLTTRPSSIVKQQKEGTLAPGEVPFLTLAKQSEDPTSGTPSTVLSAEDETGNAEGSGSEDVVLNTNNNSANELSFDGSEEGSAEKYQKISVRSKVTEIESSVMGAMEPSRSESEGGDGDEGMEDSMIGAYQREAIPWNPGTVQRQKEEIEGKMREGSPTSAAPMKFGEDAKGEDENEAKEEKEESTHDVSQKDELASSEETGHNEKETADSCQIPPSTSEEGIGIEGHQGTGNGHSVQRVNGESCNLEDRGEESAAMDTGEVSQADTTDTATLYTTSGEEIQLSMGIVSRHKREFEQKTGQQQQQQSKVEAAAGRQDAQEKPEEEQESCEEKETADAEHTDECQTGDGQDADAATGEVLEVAYPDEGSTWKVGDVRRHTMEFEEKMDMASTSPTKRASFRIGSEDEKLTPDEVRKIKDLEKIQLTSPAADTEVCPDPDGSGDSDQGESGGVVKVSDRVKKLELKRCASIAKMSNEKVAKQRSTNGSDKQTPRWMHPAKEAATHHETPVPETGAQGSDAHQSGGDEPLVQLNLDHVRLFTSQLEGDSSLHAPTEAKKVSRKSESDKDSVTSAHPSQSKRLHGPSHPLNKLGSKIGASKGGSSRGKFYSTM
ncbi:uncharacterized protein [Diadema antillarum]|uniref:uncharacterized protein n=1 Tax=Diadema antillarum TaxID=105358 RepID=UPI003A85A2F7